MLAETRLWHLENFNLLESLSTNEKMKMAKMIRDRFINKGEYIYFPEEASRNIYFLKEGRVKIGTYSDDGKEIIKAILHPGEIFGELSLVGEEKRSDFAQAIDGKVVICSMQMQDMEMMMQQNPALNFKVTKLIGFRLQKVERRLESLVFKDARTRIIELIKDLAVEQGKKIGDEILVKHFLTHQDIANLTATSRQTVTTVLNDLKDKDLIYMERNKFLIRDINRLI